MIQSPNEIDLAKGFIHDVLVIAIPGLVQTRPLKYNYTAYGRIVNKVVQQACANIYKMLLERKCDTLNFSDYEHTVNVLANNFYFCKFHETAERNSVTVNSTRIYKFIAWFCRNAKKVLYWDDTKITSTEKEAIWNTLLGQQLAKDKLFVSQQKITTKSARQKSTISNKSNTSNNTSTSNQPTTSSTNQLGGALSSWKARGPLSGAAVDLITPQNQKEILTGNLYCILGIDSNGNLLEDCAYIRPVENTQTNINKYSTKDPSDSHLTNKVLFGKAKGNGYCCCYFTNLTDANNFMSMLAPAIMPKHVTKISVYKKKAQPNGYFKVGTIFGPCYISAAKLNEDLEVDTLTEDLQKELQEKAEVFKKYDNLFMNFN